jgi:3-isopropylmalate/(R)-2-methylmalate dehydratase small subunit
MATTKVVLKLGDDVSTDIIYPGRYMATVLPTETPKFAFADHTEFNARLVAKQVPPGSVVAGGDNFGCGSSREQAASCLRGHELTVVARSFARIFLQNAINVGLRTIQCPELVAEEGDELEITADAVVSRTRGRKYAITPLPKARQAIVEAGGLVPYVRQRMMESAAGRR